MADKPSPLEEMFEVVDDEGVPSSGFVPHRGGRVRADKQVIVSFRVTARERYLWSMLAAKRGNSVSDMVRSVLNQMVEDEDE